MAILSLSSSMEITMATIAALTALFLAGRWDYRRIKSYGPPPKPSVDLGAEIYAYKLARDKEDAKEWRPGNPERHAGPSSRSDRLPYGRKP